MFRNSQVPEMPWRKGNLGVRKPGENQQAMAPLHKSLLQRRGLKKTPARHMQAAAVTLLGPESDKNEAHNY